MRKLILLLFLFGQSSNAIGQMKVEVKPVHPGLDQFLNVRDFCISKDQDEMYFTVQSPSQKISQIVTIQKVKGQWGEPVLMSFSEGTTDMEPFLSPDQKRLYFASDRMLNSDTIADFNIWYVERISKTSAWSKPVMLESPVNSEGDEFYPSITLNGNLYFTAERKNGFGKDDIYYCRFVNGKYEAPVALDSAINSDGMEFNAFVSPDDQMIIYSKYNNPGGKGSGDLYISKRDENGNWLPAMNLDLGINTKYMEYCPYYDKDSGTLYFTSRRENLAQRKFKNLGEMNTYISGAENGLSKLYMVKIKLN